MSWVLIEVARLRISFSPFCSVMNGGGMGLFSSREFDTGSGLVSSDGERDEDGDGEGKDCGG